MYLNHFKNTISDVKFVEEFESFIRIVLRLDETSTLSPFLLKDSLFDPRTFQDFQES